MNEAKPLAKRQFASDNLSGVTPEAWAALESANSGHAQAYGDDSWTDCVAEKMRELFERDCDLYFTFNGTASNSLAIASLCQSYHSVICQQYAHIEVDECGAPEFFSHGAKVLVAGGENGKLSAEAVRKLITKRSDIHFPKAKVLSLTQATEQGTVYTVDEVAELCTLAKAHELRTHMDGARFANAVAHLECSPADLTWRAGVDVLCFGGTKLGMPVGDLVVFFDRTLSAEFAYRCKQAGQLASKMRFLAAPWLGMLRDDAWLSYAKSTNTMAQYLAKCLAAEGIAARYPVQANAVFADLPEQTCQAMHDKGWLFYTFIGDGGARLMCSWDITKEDVNAFVDDLRVALAEK